MMVGPSGSGKSMAWRVLLKALERLEGIEGVSYVIDPKAISKVKLLLMNITLIRPTYCVVWMESIDNMKCWLLCSFGEVLQVLFTVITIKICNNCNLKWEDVFRDNLIYLKSDSLGYCPAL